MSESEFKILTSKLSIVGHVATVCRGEDLADLQQDVTLIALRMVDSLERRGLPVLLTSVAYYSLQQVKSGRRSGYSGRCDVYGAATQLDGHSTLISECGMDPQHEGGDEHDAVMLVECLPAGSDTARTAQQRLDWAALLARLNERERLVVQATAQGERGLDTAERLGLRAPRVVQLKRGVAKKIAVLWGADTLYEVGQRPQWRRELEQAGGNRRQGEGGAALVD